MKAALGRAPADTPISPIAHLRRCLIVALLYALAGGAAMVLPLSSGYASPVWPAAGVAVAALLIWGPRCWPGVWLSGLSTNLWFDPSAAGAGLAALIASAVTAQALLGAWLARRYFRNDLPFAHDWRLGRVLIGAGPLACLLSASLSTAIRFFGGRLEEAALLDEWLRWWSGDTLGVLLFAPLSLLLWPGAHPFRVLGGGSYRFALPLIVTTALLVLGHLGLAQLIDLRARSQTHALMEVISDNETQAIVETLLPLQGLAHFFTASREVTREEFREYAHSFLDHPAILSVDWAPRITAAQRSGFEASMLAEGFETFRIAELDDQGELQPASRRAEYFPILYSEPFAVSRDVLGLDHGFDPLRRQAMATARDNGIAVASDRIHLPRTGRHASLAYIPVWRQAGGERPQHPAGYVAGVVDIPQLFAPLVERARAQGLAVRITDITRDNPPHPLIDGLRSGASPDWRREFHFGSRTWRLEMQPDSPPRLPGPSSEERLFLGFTLLTALLAAFATLSSTGRHALINREVSERTAQLRSELDARSAAERALHLSEERYRQLIELSPLGILVQCDGRFMFVNTRTLAMFGARSADQLLGRALIDFVHPDSRDIIRERTELRSKGLPAPNPTVIHYHRLDGSYSWAELSSVPYLHGGRLGSLILLNDISARIRAEEQHDRFFNLSLDLFCIASTDGHFKSVNPAFTRILGWSEEELLSRPMFDFVHPDDIPATRHELQHLAHNNNSTLGFENRYRCKDGSWRWLSWKALPQPGQLLFATARDMTEQHRAARQLTELNAELQQRIEERSRTLTELEAKKEEIRAVLDHLLECVITIDRHGTIRRVNPAIEPLLGYTPAELLGRNVSCLMDSPHRDQHDGYLARYLQSGERHIIGSSREVTGRHKNGTAVSLELSVSEYRIDGEHLFIGTLRDIRERRALIASLTQAREDAEQASRAKSAFLAAMSHEIRTPMNGVIGLIDVLAQDDLNLQQADLVKTIRESAGNLLSIIDDILDFSKIEAGKLEIGQETVDFPALLEEQGRTLIPLAEAKGVDLEVHVEAGMPRWIHADPLRLRQILCNLVGNAIKFSSTERNPSAGRGRIHVRARVRAATPLQVVLEVEDNGIGISAAHQRNLFTPFTQAESSTTRRFGGTGLGLAICKRLVDLMNGEIGVDSCPGRGSLFSVRLPLEPASPPASIDPTPPPAPSARGDGRSHRILVAEDDAVNRKVIQHQLALLGHHCEIARNGVEALERWRDAPYDLLLTDLHMPEMDGYQLAGCIRREENGERRIPILVLTANALRDEATRAKAAGMDEYLTKPIRLATLKAALERWLPHTTAAAEPAKITQPGAAAPVEEILLDTQALDTLVGGDRQMAAEVLHDYVESLDALAIELEDSFGCGDHAAMGALAHRLKSSSRAVGAQRLAQLCSLLEQTAKAADSATLAHCTSEFRSIHAATRRQIEQQLAGEQPA
ncbi:diguanylate cyclase/phosphodiesterase (GGDEF & EAL domains) with PAS/PAC sensor(s) [Thauera chlorobenzoica]|uniref:Sensor protein FixL n=2 Tax=Thauera chlorobenzoica TaxID=96773 RepID=A0A1L6FDS1_9RHOO|nr:diguanylate cyclase/phosphodiesterase (GGDEF & EAL domains) with PAS/PAC sensor(s) [Thauera chlorobenzoica]